MIRTPTLAEIYARQGHLDQAIEMYEALCADQPDQADWSARLDVLRREHAERDDPGADDRAKQIARLRRLSERITSRKREL